MSKYLLFSFLLVSSFLTAQIPAVAQSASPAIAFSQPKWEEQEAYVHGFARVLQHDHFSFINQSGSLIHPVSFDGARNFSHHLAAVKQEDRWGFINEAGNLVIPCSYQVAFDFTENVTATYANRKWQLIDTNGRVIMPLNITAFYGFKNGIAKISKDGKWGTMNTRGEISLTNSQLNAPVVNTKFPKPFTPSSISSASVCPDNIDFEFGSFLNWECFIGKVDSVGTTNVITVNPSPPTPNRHTLYSRVLPSPLDAFGLFPINPPDGSNFALKLGNTQIGAQAERVRYKIRVPVNDSNFSIKYDYAVVFEDPGHTIWTQPRFNVKVIDSAANAYVQCASFEYISTSGLPGFARSTVDTGVIYKPWSTVFLSLRGYAGKTMYLEFTTADCVRRGHWGYAYVDVEKPCGQSVEMSYDCSAPNITTLTAPPGFQTYNWWDQTYGTLLGTGQQIVLNPGPAVNSIIWLEMIPYNNFGCTDTLKVTITGVFNANFNMSDTVGVCAPHAFTFYNTNLPSSSVTWDFGDGTTGTGDTVTHTYLIPGNFIVKMHVVLPGGCVGDALKTVSVLQPVGSFSFNQTYYCNNQTVRFDAVVNSADSLIWDFGDGNILRTLLTTVFHTYLNPGTYLPTLTLKSNNGCKNTVLAPDTVKIELLGPGYIYNDVKQCGSTTVNFTDTSFSYFGITTRQWNFGDGTSGSGTNVSHTYTTPGTYNVRLIITGTSGCTDTLTKPIIITVNQQPAATITSPAAQCQSVPVTFTSNVTSADPVTYYHWTVSNGFTGAGTSFTTTFNVAGTYTIQLIVGTVNGCYDTTTTTIVINPTPDVIAPPNQDLCNGSNTTAVNFTGAVAGTVYTWTNTAPIIGLAASGTGNIPSFTASSNGTSTAVAGITVKPTASGCPGPSKTFSITVHPTPSVVQPASQTLCEGSNTAAVNFTGVVSGTAYNWTNNNPAIGLAASGSGNIPSFIATSNGANITVATITVTPTAGGCPGTPKTFTITVNPEPTVLQPADQVLCNNSNTAAINFTGAVSGTSYSWTNSNPAIGLGASGTGNIPSFIATSNGTTTAVATITVTPSANGCTGIPKTFTITVNPTPDVAQPVDQTLCNNSNTAAINFTGAVSGTAYNWTNSNTVIGLGASGTGNIPSFSASSNGANIAVATITVTPSANGCSSNPKTFTITVNPTPDVAQPADQTLCNNSTTAAINFTGAVNGTAYNWTNSNTVIGLGASGTGNIPSFIASSNGANIAVANIVVTPSANGCPGTPKTFTVTVNPTPAVVQPANQTLCNNSNTAAINFAGAVTNTTYNWSNTNTAIGLAASGTGNIPSFTATSNGANITTATITVTPAANGCPGVPKTFIITVNPTPDVLQPADQTLCSNSNTAAINFTGPVSNTVYNWTNSNPAIGLTAVGSGNIPSFAAISNGANVASAIITVTPSANGCSNTPKSFSITVNPVPDVAQPANQALCNNSNTTSINFSGTVNNTVYNWTNNNSAIGLGASGTGNIPSFTAINKTPAAVIATITVTPGTASCPGIPKVFDILINPTPDVNASNDALVCLGNTVQLSATGAAQYSWTPAVNLNCVSCATPLAKPTDSITYTVKGTNAAGCSASDSVVLSVIKPFNMTVSPNDTLCMGEGKNIRAFNASRYLWSPAAGLNRTDIADPTVKTNVSTTYRVIGFDNYQCFTDTGYVSIIVGPKPFVNIGPDRTLATGTPLQLNAATSGGPIVSWMWTPAADLSCNNCPSPKTTVKNNSFYSVLVTNTFGCTAADTIFINSFCKSAQVFIPNAFTPDGDGLNDILMVRGNGITVKSFRIFNRWGELVFEKENFYPNDPKYGWDGRVRGVPATPDVFVYTAEVFCDNGVVYTYKGNTTILK